MVVTGGLQFSVPSLYNIIISIINVSTAFITTSENTGEQARLAGQLGPLFEGVQHVGLHGVVAAMASSSACRPYTI